MVTKKRKRTSEDKKMLESNVMHNCIDDIKYLIASQPATHSFHFIPN